ncbi:TetR family transcriptional regulator [Microlunatus endophyticus]|uniref:TetR family transcriptional regulator n=1 Tax=Microlunatus endophyticus TaxID=1716077 RepID=A0A917SFL8_9ACTN|nr:TetR/AcrR family transcriptional regulator [Microlunatus endophyticus]GGL73811.1 TetR family transcriptional regulator [Microlunatus endophyticus]
MSSGRHSPRTATRPLEEGTPTQRAIARAARELFERSGYEGTSVREIAAAAGVDAALVIRHYGSKEELFVRVIGFDEHFAPQLDGPLELVGTRLADYVLDPTHDRMRRTLTALLYASDHQNVRTDLQATMRRLLVDRLSARMHGADTVLRAWLVSAQLLGLVHSWDAVDTDHATAAQRTHVANLYGAAIQQLITPPT